MSRNLRLDHVESTLLVGPSVLNDPDGLAQCVIQAKVSALGVSVDQIDRVDDLADWQAPVTGVVSVPRNVVDGAAPDDTTPVRMAQVVVRGRRKS